MKMDLANTTEKITRITDNAKGVTTKAGLKRLGFTPKLIDLLLPKPFKKAILPSTGTTRYCCLWNTDDVEKAMTEPIFEEKQKARARKKEKKRKQAAETKAKAEEKNKEKAIKFLNKIDRIKTPERINLAIVKQHAISKKFEEDLIAEYIFSRLSGNDDLLVELESMRNVDKKIYNVFLRKIIEKIVKVYPELSEACERMYARRSKPE